jgi:hypothetical protein
MGISDNANRRLPCHILESDAVRPEHVSPEAPKMEISGDTYLTDPNHQDSRRYRTDSYSGKLGSLSHRLSLEGKIQGIITDDGLDEAPDGPPEEPRGVPRDRIDVLIYLELRPATFDDLCSGKI